MLRAVDDDSTWQWTRPVAGFDKASDWWGALLLAVVDPHAMRIVVVCVVLFQQ
jgi:hypothetical protein